MGDLTSGAEKDTSNFKLSFEAELSILAYEFKRRYLDNTDIDLTRSVVFVEMLEDFYKEAERIRAKLNGWWYLCPICNQYGYASMFGDGCTDCSNKRLFNKDGSHKIPHPTWDEKQIKDFQNAKRL